MRPHKTDPPGMMDDEEATPYDVEDLIPAPQHEIRRVYGFVAEWLRGDLPSYRLDTEPEDGHDPTIAFRLPTRQAARSRFDTEFNAIFHAQFAFQTPSRALMPRRRMIETMRAKRGTQPDLRIHILGGVPDINRNDFVSMRYYVVRCGARHLAPEAWRVGTAIFRMRGHVDEPGAIVWRSLIEIDTEPGIPSEPFGPLRLSENTEVP